MPVVTLSFGSGRYLLVLSLSQINHPGPSGKRAQGDLIVPCMCGPLLHLTYWQGGRGGEWEGPWLCELIQIFRKACGYSVQCCISSGLGSMFFKPVRLLSLSWLNASFWQENQCIFFLVKCLKLLGACTLLMLIAQGQHAYNGHTALQWQHIHTDKPRPHRNSPALYPQGVYYFWTSQQTHVLWCMWMNHL